MGLFDANVQFSLLGLKHLLDGIRVARRLLFLVLLCFSHVVADSSKSISLDFISVTFVCPAHKHPIRWIRRIISLYNRLNIIPIVIIVTDFCADRVHAWLPRLGHNLHFKPINFVK